MGNSIVIFKEGYIPSKKNVQRATQNRRTGMIFVRKNASVAQFEREVISIAKLSGFKEKITGPFQISGVIAINNTKDLDGALASILDALQYAGVIENDKYLRRIVRLEKIAVRKRTIPERFHLTIEQIDDSVEEQ